MRILRLATIVLLSTASAQAANSSRHLSHHQYVKSIVGKGAWVSSVTGAVVNQVRNAPHEWGSGATGFGKRLASGWGVHAVKETIQFGVAKVRHEDLAYHPSGEQRFAPRLRYALMSTVVTRKTTTGDKTVAAGNISGALGSGIISRAWMPARLHTLGSGLATGGIILGASAGTNVVREFWPEIRHPHSH